HHDETKLTNFFQVSEKTNGLVPKLVGFSAMRILVLVLHGLSDCAQIGRALKGDYQRQSAVEDFSTPHPGPLPVRGGEGEAFGWSVWFAISVATPRLCVFALNRISIHQRQSAVEPGF